MIITKDQITVPLTVPQAMTKTYIEHYLKATLNSGRLFLFAGDQKIEHLNETFCGKNIPPEVADPQHLFKIASQSRIGVFATHLGLAARYGAMYKNIRYLIKLNAKTNLLPTKEQDPTSAQLYTVDDVVAFKKNSGLDIVAVGCTVYLGSSFESEMLAFASRMVLTAHSQGLLAVIWMYPRGQAIKHERTKEIVAGAAGVANALGADFVKINPPDAGDDVECGEALRSAVIAAGNTKVICAGGCKVDNKICIKSVHNQIIVGKTGGVAIGRNIYQNSLPKAIAMCESLAAIIAENIDLETAIKKIS